MKGMKCKGCASEGKGLGSLEKPANRTPSQVISKNTPIPQHNHKTFKLGGRGSGVRMV